jgi:hypothetical protein
VPGRISHGEPVALRRAIEVNQSGSFVDLNRTVPASSRPECISRGAPALRFCLIPLAFFQLKKSRHRLQ